MDNIDVSEQCETSFLLKLSEVILISSLNIQVIDPMIFFRGKTCYTLVTHSKQEFLKISANDTFS